MRVLNSLIVASLVCSGCALFEPAEEVFDPSDPNNQRVFPSDAAELLGSCTAPLYASGLTADWTTPNTIRWAWDYSGTDEPLDTFVLAIGATEEDVRARTNVRLIGPAQSRELSKVTGEHRRSWTVSSGHDPETAYFARLIGVDPRGCTSESNIAQATTTVLPDKEVVIFSEDATEGYSIPSQVVLASRAPFQGDFHYEWEATCDGEPSCYEIVRRQDMGIKVTEMTESEFDGAFLEFATLNEGFAVGQFDQVRFQFRVGGESVLWSRDDYLTVAPGEAYRVHQIPLDQFFRDGAPMTWDDLTAGEIHEFGFGATWTAGSMISFDEVRIRY